MKIDVVVTKNPSFLAYLMQEGIVSTTVRWLKYVTAADIIDKHVLGDSLPYCLSSVALSYTEIPLLLPRELVGQRLLTADYEKYADNPVVYSINRLPWVSVEDTPHPFRPWTFTMEVS